MALSEKEFDYTAAFHIMELSIQLKDKAMFYVEKEKELVDQYAKKDGGKIVWGRNGFLLADPSKADEYQAKRKELDNIEVEWNRKAKLRIDRITPAQLSALSDFVEFEVV